MLVGEATQAGQEHGPVLRWEWGCSARNAGTYVAPQLLHDLHTTARIAREHHGSVHKQPRPRHELARVSPPPSRLRAESRRLLVPWSSRTFLRMSSKDPLSMKTLSTAWGPAGSSSGADILCPLPAPSPVRHRAAAWVAYIWGPGLVVGLAVCCW